MHATLRIPCCPYQWTPGMGNVPRSCRLLYGACAVMAWNESCVCSWHALIQEKHWLLGFCKVV